jgi:xylulokinase
MASTVLVGIDIGSSSVKAGVWRTDGYYRAAFRTARVVRPEGSAGAEQDPDQIWAAVVECLDEVMDGQDPGAVRGVGLSGHGPSLIAVDSYGRALSNIVTWMDPRPLQDARVREILRQRAGEASGAPESSSARESSGAPAPSGPSFEATAVWLHRKLLEDGHDLAREGVLLLQPKDYIGLMLTGSVWIDRSAASCMSWPAGGDPAQSLFPSMVDPWQRAGEVSTVASGETGLPEGAPVAAGGIDAFVEALGAGVIRPGVACDSTGTSTCLAMAAPGGGFSLPTVEHVAPGPRLAVIPVSYSGGALAWAMSMMMPDVFRGQRDWTSPVREAVEGSAPGAAGLTFIPHMTGRRSPSANPRVRGALIGLDPVHTASDVIRSVLEGCAYAMQECVEECMPGEAVAELRAVGSGARHDAWLQMKADILRAPVVRMKVCEGALAGAVVLAGAAAGVFEDVEDGVGAVVRPEAKFEPTQDPEVCAAYSDGAARFRRAEASLETAW